LTALRLVFLLPELAGLGLLLLLLRETGRSPLWSALYWWNPLVAKELVNSAHMDGLILPFVLGALLLAVRRRTIWSSGLLALATGVKLWPVLLLPLVLRPLIGTWRVLAASLAVFAAVTGLVFLPLLVTQLDGGSGFVAYAQSWERNDALFSLIRGGLARLFESMGSYQWDAGRFARLLAALIVLAVTLGLSWRIARDPTDLCRRALFIIAALFLLSPTGYPWYFLWFAPLLAILPVTGLLALTVLLPLYYLRFHFEDQGRSALFESVIVWIEFAPVFLLLAWQALRARSPVSQSLSTPAAVTR
jgi:uncharacterized membrane protein